MGPFLNSLTVLVCSVLVFMCLLIIPGRRRKKFRELLRVQQMEEAAEEEKMRQMNENFTLGVKDEQDSGVGNSAGE